MGDPKALLVCTHSTASETLSRSVYSPVCRVIRPRSMGCASFRADVSAVRASRFVRSCAWESAGTSGLPINSFDESALPIKITGDPGAHGCGFCLPLSNSRDSIPLLDSANATMSCSPGSSGFRLQRVSTLFLRRLQHLEHVG